MALFDVGMLAISATFVASGHFLVVVAFRGGVDVAAIAPFRYTLLIWAGVCGYLAFGEVPDRFGIFGFCADRRQRALCAAPRGRAPPRGCRRQCLRASPGLSRPPPRPALRRRAVRRASSITGSNRTPKQSPAIQATLPFIGRSRRT